MTDVRLTATNPEDSSVVPVACNDKGELKLEEPITFDGNLDGDLNVAGNIKAGDIESGGTVEAVRFTAGNDTFTGAGTSISEAGNIYLQAATANTGIAFSIVNPENVNQPEVTINHDGSSIFGSNKAGFTKEGYLWCTTRRGDTVVLDATSNGLGTWADYTPPTRRDQAKEKLDTLRDESNTISQDLPETPTGTP